LLKTIVRWIVVERDPVEQPATTADRVPGWLFRIVLEITITGCKD